MDSDLREIFSVLRAEDRHLGTSFRAVLERSRSRGRATSRRWVAAASLAAVGTVIVVALVNTMNRPSPRLWMQPSLSATSWRAPTDFLLETPGRELLGSMPSLGSPTDWPLPAASGGAPTDTNPTGFDRRTQS
jgi:hypothetical protein